MSMRRVNRIADLTSWAVVFGAFLLAIILVAEWVGTAYAQPQINGCSQIKPASVCSSRMDATNPKLAGTNRFTGKNVFVKPTGAWLQDSLWGWSAVAETARYAIGGYADSARVAASAWKLTALLLSIYPLPSGAIGVDSAGGRVDSLARVKWVRTAANVFNAKNADSLNHVQGSDYARLSQRNTYTTRWVSSIDTAALFENEQTGDGTGVALLLGPYNKSYMAKISAWGYPGNDYHCNLWLQPHKASNNVLGKGIYLYNDIDSGGTAKRDTIFAKWDSISSRLAAVHTVSWSASLDTIKNLWTQRDSNLVTVQDTGITRKKSLWVSAALSPADTASLTNSRLKVDTIGGPRARITYPDTNDFTGGMLLLPYNPGVCPELTENGQVMVCAAGLYFYNASGSHTFFRTDTSQLIDGTVHGTKFQGAAAGDTLIQGYNTSTPATKTFLLLTNGFLYAVTLHPDSLWGRDSTSWSAGGGGGTSVDTMGHKFFWKTPDTLASTTGKQVFRDTTTFVGQTIFKWVTGKPESLWKAVIAGGDTVTAWLRKNGDMALRSVATAKQSRFNFTPNLKSSWSDSAVTGLTNGGVKLTKAGSYWRKDWNPVILNGADVMPDSVVGVVRVKGYTAGVGASAYACSLRSDLASPIDLGTDAKWGGPDSFSVEYWAKPVALSAALQICYGEDNRVTCGFSYDKPYFRTYNASDGFKILTASSVTCTVGIWSHFTFLFRNNYQMVIYKNGVAIDSVAASTKPLYYSTRQTFWGYGAYDAVGYAGVIDEARVYDIPLSQDTITAHYNSGAGQYGSQNSHQIGAYHFDDGTGTNADDYGPNGFDGTLTNSPAWVVGKVPNGGESTPRQPDTLFVRVFSLNDSGAPVLTAVIDTILSDTTGAGPARQRVARAWPSTFRPMVANHSYFWDYYSSQVPNDSTNVYSTAVLFHTRMPTSTGATMLAMAGGFFWQGLGLLGIIVAGGAVYAKLRRRKEGGACA